MKSGVIEPAASVHLAVLLLLNVVVQTLFSYLVYSAFRQPEIDADTVSGFRTWRRNTGHDLAGYSVSTESSMAQRVCDGDSSLDSSTNQAQTVEELNQYLGPDGLGMDGVLMCLLALLTWILTVSKELLASTAIVRAVIRLPIAKETSITVDEDGEEMTVVAMSRARVCAWLATCGIRMGIAVFLLVYGILFVAHTISLQDLLLSSVAATRTRHGACITSWPRRTACRALWPLDRKSVV